MKLIIFFFIFFVDFVYLVKDIEMINCSEVDWVYIDIMDGVFVLNIFFGFLVLKYVVKLILKLLDVYLMIVNLEKFIFEVKVLGVYIMNVYYEVCFYLYWVV